MNTLSRNTLVLLLSFASLSLQAGILDHYFIQEKEKMGLTADSPTLKTAWFSQRLNADDPDTPFFNQRYYINEEFGPEDSAPVFFYICGEASCEPSALNGAIRNYARQFHAKLVALEHRYYGKSQPFNRLSSENLRFLSTEAALNDLAYFQRWLQKNYHWKGRWIAFGGSYPGSLSAYYRMKYPYLIEGALASSAPVQAKEAFIEYDQHITAVAGPVCANAMREVVSTIEASEHSAQGFEAMKKRFAAEAVIDRRDFYYVVADVGAAAVQYGMKDAFCHQLTSAKDPVQAYADFAKMIYQRFGISAVDLTPQGAMSESVDDVAEGVGMRQWLYQSCSEYGYWQIAHPNPAFSTRSTSIDLDYHHQICQRLFNRDTATDTDRINNDYFSPLLNHLTQNIYFTNGSNDPWSTLSLRPDNGKGDNPNLSYQLIEGSAHCDDLHTPLASDSKALQQSRNKMKKLLEQWLYG